MMLSISIKPVLREISLLCYVKFEIILNCLLTVAKVTRFFLRTEISLDDINVNFIFSFNCCKGNTIFTEKNFLDNSMLTLKLFFLLTVVKVLTR